MMRTRGVFVAVSMAVVLLLAGLLVAARAQQEDLFRALGTLTEVIHLVDSQYVEEVDLVALREGLDAGLMEAVDPWAALLEGAEVEAFEEVLQGPPAFGLVLGSRLGSAAVRQVLPGSPAEAAGLEVGEVIERVQGGNTRGRPLWRLQLELAHQLTAGAPATLTVMDQTIEERREVVLEPADWALRAVSQRVVDGVTVIDVAALPKGVAAELRAALPAAGAAVIDLRELSWGYEEDALAAVDLFAARGNLGTWRGRRAGAGEFPADPAAVTPPVVLIGPMTEGMGEVLAAGLSAAGAVLVGSTTAGHAPHMAMVHDGDVHLWIPVGHWLRADGEPISDNGIEPDEEVGEPGQPMVWPQADDEGEDDPALQRALELVLGRHAAAA